MITEKEASVYEDSIMVGLVWRTFLNKTFICLVFTGMSFYIVVEYWSTMNTSTYIEFKVIGCFISFLLLIPSLRETFIFASIIAVDDWNHEELLSATEGFTGIIFCLITCCCPCLSIIHLMERRKLAPILGVIIAFVDVYQTLSLFPLAVVVILTSESEVEIFVNMIAVQVFANLDDLFAYGMSKYLGPKVKESASALYIRWEGEGTKKSELDSLSMKVDLLTETVLLLKKHHEHVDDGEDNKNDAGDASKVQVTINAD